MVELTVLNYLTADLAEAGIPVYMERPYDPPGSYVIVEKTGSYMENHIYRATIAVQSYAPSLLEAAKLNEVIKDSMLDIVTLDAVASIRLNSDYNYIDTATKSYRYQAVFDIVAYDD